MKTVVKDLRKGLSGKAEPDRTFLHQYMTLTRCDLFFADKAILIEGTSERLLLPRMIKMLDEGKPDAQKLSSQYISVIEVGGAYAHIFFDLLAFLDLKALIITDIDTVKPNAKGQHEACQVRMGQGTSNGCLKTWFKKDVATAELLAADDVAKISEKRRVAYQQPEGPGGPCGRSFEDAFMLANPSLFPLAGPSEADREQQAWEDAKYIKKSEFALKHALSPHTWHIPRYISEGLLWLAEGPEKPVVPTTTVEGTAK